MSLDEGRNILALRRGPRLSGHCGSFPALGEPCYRPFPEAPESGTGKGRVRILDREQLASLRYLPDQSLTLVVENEGGEQLSDVSVTLSVFSENTALSNFRYYRKTVQKIPAGEAARVRFEFDLLVREEPVARPPTANPEQSREILEIKATTPEGNSTVRTVILPP
jgi:hypothetical protein